MALRIEPVGYDHPDAATLIERVQEEYVARYGSRDDSPIDPLMFLPPEGTFLLGYVDDEPVASGAWRRSPVRELGGTRAVEIKRMYVVPEHRSAGHARVMLAALERTAAAAGYDLVVLETGTRQPEAMALYVSEGYEPVPGFGHYRDEPLSRCFGKRLTGRSGGPRESSQRQHQDHQDREADQQAEGGGAESRRP